MLGIVWEEFNDYFLFDLKEVAVNALTLKVTKRNGFFVLPSIFDPVGLLQPFYCYLESNFTKNLFNKNRLGLKDS